MIDLGEIVIRCGQPEDRNRFDARRRSLLRQLHRGQSFIDGKRWSAEQADLLPSDDGRRALSQTVQIRESLRRSAPGFVLALKNRADKLTASGIILQCGSLSLGPLAEVRRVRIERLDVGGICKKVRKEPGGMRDLGKGQTLRFHRGLS